VTDPTYACHSYFFPHLFNILSSTNFALLFQSLLIESKLILISDEPQNLAYMVEALTSLLYPLEWSFIIIPLLNEQTMGFIDAPVPFIIGMTSE
jgi:hypothetical protein